MKKKENEKSKMKEENERGRNKKMNQVSLSIGIIRKFQISAL